MYLNELLLSESTTWLDRLTRFIEHQMSNLEWLWKCQSLEIFQSSQIPKFDLIWPWSGCQMETILTESDSLNWTRMTSQWLCSWFCVSLSWWFQIPNPNFCSTCTSSKDKTIRMEFTTRWNIVIICTDQFSTWNYMSFHIWYISKKPVLRSLNIQDLSFEVVKQKSLVGWSDKSVIASEWSLNRFWETFSSFS